MRHMPWSQMPQGAGPSRAARSSSQPHTPPSSGHSAPPRAAKDLDTIAGDRWFQTSITCSWSSPALHGSGGPQEAGRRPSVSPQSRARSAKATGEHEMLAASGWPEGGTSAAPPSAAGGRPSQAADGERRPPSRGGLRRNGGRPGPQAAGETENQGLSETVPWRQSLPTLTPAGSQRSVSQVFTVADLARA